MCDQAMTTNVQVLTDEGSVTAVVQEGRKLSVVYQNIRTVPSVLLENYGHWVEILDLSHNKLRDLSSLRYLPRLHTLIMDHNLISSESSVARLPSLRVLWLNFNLITDLGKFLPTLARSCPYLVHLSLMGNMVAPIMHREDGDSNVYRQFVLSHMKHLRHLDDRPVSPLERARSTHSYQEPTYWQDFQSAFHDVKDYVVARFNRCNSVV